MLADGENPGMVSQTVFQCSVPYCERSFDDSYTLTEHLKNHADEKRHICPVRACGRRFSTQGNLSRHKRLHGPIKPLRCPVIGCICTFRSENKLSKHMKFHLGSSVHVCRSPTCGKTFSTAGNLNRHIKGHHPELDLRKKKKILVSNMMPLRKADPLNGSPTGSDELLLTNVTYNPMTRPTSCESTMSPLHAAPSSPASRSPSTSPIVSLTSSLTLPDPTSDPKQFDALVSTLNETIKVEDLEPHVLQSENLWTEQAVITPPSVLDDMIRFHINYL
ncbi:unnamed protein product [Peronospora belbahrii]|uniref:C2H2-type domain-containing protein n=1 Tax=Peronospora belbahrii TaxID=622444 RepID=A0AAU9L6X2_9STRA|nr:unnamed protein product [Peronospora belbahrii]CAH0519617.1 unnamed protein product [Peronospora belbahrii]